jgi:hypothetical protein
MKWLSYILMLGLVMTSQGCVSKLAHNSWQEAQVRRAVRVEADGEQVLVGVDLLSMDYLKDNWMVAIPAAIADGAILYYSYEALNGLRDSINKDDQPSSRGDGSTTLILNSSQGNTINVVSGTDNDSNADREVDGMSNTSNFDQE